MNAHECFSAGDLAGALAAATESVKNHPADTTRRGLLCELLCFAGQWDRADKHLDAIAEQSPELLPGLSVFRQLLRGELARQQCFREGRLPEFLGEPTAALKRHLEALIRLREGEQAAAAELLALAEQERPPVSGVCDGARFEDFRDMDDATASFFEVLTSGGKYFWIPVERVRLVEFHAPKRPRDLLWRRAHMVVHDGPDGEVYVPSLYAGSCDESDALIRLGRFTDWRGGEGAPVRGVGQRIFLVGEQACPILQCKELVIDG